MFGVRNIFTYLALGLILSVGPAARPYPPTLDTARVQYEKLRLQIAADSGKRHLVLANSLEDRRILIQALDQFKLARELSAGRMQSLASRAYSKLSSLNPAFVSSYYRKPSASERKRYKGKAGAEHAKDRRGWKRLADFASKYPEELLKDALAGYKRLFSDCDELQKFDAKGRIILPEGPIPESISSILAESEGTVLLNGQKYLRNAFFKCIPEIKEADEIFSKNLRIISQTPLDMIPEVFTLAEALYKVLKKDFKDCPDRCLDLFIFTDRPSYESYCQESENRPYSEIYAFANLQHFTSAICLVAKNGDKLNREELQCLVMHELVHLFHYGINGTVMPDWYEEGLAETYGGPGTFDWTNGKLKVKGNLERRRLEAICKPDGLIDINAFLVTETRSQVTEESNPTLRFYAQSWAFLNYLRNQAGVKRARKLNAWEEECYSRRLDRKEARELFLMKFLKDLDSLEKGFKEYLQKLIKD